MKQMFEIVILKNVLKRRSHSTGALIQGNVFFTLLTLEHFMENIIVYLPNNQQKKIALSLSEIRVNILPRGINFTGHAYNCIKNRNLVQVSTYLPIYDFLLLF